MKKVYTVKTALKFFITGILLLISFLYSFKINAQISFTGTTYTQDFNSLITSGTGQAWTNNTTLAGWFLFRAPAPGTAITTYNAADGGNNTGSFISFGTGTSTERAFGGTGSGGTYFGSPASGAIGGWIAVAFTNTTGSTINDVTIAFNGEQWRNGGNTTAQTMVLEYGFGSTFDLVSWTAPGGNFDWTSVVNTATAAAVDGNTAGKVSGKGGTLTSLGWINGSTLWVRWVERNDVGNDHGLAIDDFTFSATVVTPTTPVITITTPDDDIAETGPNPGTFRISRTGATTDPLTINYSISGTAGASDYTPTLTGSATILSGQASVDIIITPVDDANNEGDETVILELQDAAEYDLGAAAIATLTIDDNDVPVVITKIHDIQGNVASQLPNIAGSGAHNDRSPLEGQTVTIQGIVTAVYNDLNGFFIQEEDADADADLSTSEGIFVFTGVDPTVSEGDKVTVTGAVDEFFGMTQIDNDNGDFAVTLISTGNTLPSAALIDLPIAPAQDVNDFYEQYEAMRVQFPDKMVVSEYFEVARYGQIVLTENSRPFQYTHVDNTPTSSEYAAFNAELARRTIILDDENNIQNAPLGFAAPNNVFYYPRPGGLGTGTQGINYYRGGDAINDLVGVLHWSFAGQTGTDAWRIRPTQAAPIQFTVENARPAAPNVGGNIKVASFNVLNYFSTIDNGGNIAGPTGNLQEGRGADSPDELTRQTQKLVQALKGINADVFGLVELENNSGNVGANGGAIKAVVDALNAELGSTVYDFINTGNVGDDAITVGIIYKTSVVSQIGNTAILNTTAFTDPNNTSIQRNRPAIAVSFQVVDGGNRDFGAVFTVTINHLKSKGSGGDSGLDVDQNDGQGSWNDTRAKAALALTAWLATDPTGVNDPDYLIIGDLNSYKGEDPITNIKNAGYTDLAEHFGGNDAYSYVFDGQLGYLDHALANASLLPQVTGTAEWHINADEVPVFDYNNTVDDGAGEDPIEAKPAGNNLFEANAFRTSDHDPVIIGLDLACSGGTVHNGSNNYCTIQAAINAASPGDVITVDAGTYVENIVVNKSLTILGPNANTSGCDARVPEAIIIPASSQPFYDGSTEVRMMQIEADNVIIKGFTFDGDNPALATNVIDAADGIDIYVDADGIVIQNNIFKNINEGGVNGYPSGTTSLVNNIISNNKFDNIPGNADPDYPYSGYGIGILIYNDFYANVDNNCMSNVRIGVQTGNYHLANSGTPATINNNTISSDRVGIFHNLHYQSASPFTVNANNITASDPENTGMVLWSFQGNATSAITNNTINGGAVGIEAWNNPTTNTITINGGSISNARVGILNTNYSSYGDAASSILNITGITFNNCDTAMWVRDNVSNTNNATVTLTINNATNHVNGTGIGLLIEGADASVNFSAGAPASFNNTLSKYIRLIHNGANAPVDNINVQNVLFGGETGSTMSLAELFATEDKIDHQVDWGSLAFVYVKANNTFVTTNSFYTGQTTTPAIQRGVDAANNGFTVNVAAGTFNEPAQVNIAKSVTVLGAGNTLTIIKPSVNTTVGGNLPSESFIYIDPAATVMLKKFTIDGNGRQIHHAVQSRGSLTADDLIVKNIRYQQYFGRGIVFYSGTNNSVSNTIFSNIERIGIHVRGAITSPAPVVTINGITYTGKGTGDFLDYGVEIGGGGNATITNSSITNNNGVASTDGSTSAGILATTFFGPGTTALITNNYINNNTEGIAVGYDESDVSSVTANYNDLSENSTYAISSTAPLVNATCNWYGTNNAAAIAAMISGNVNYIPYLTSGTDASPATGFQTDEVCAACNATAVINTPDGTELNCNLTSISLTASGGSTYSWSNGTTVVGTDATLIVTAQGTYTVTVTTSDGCTDTESITVTEDKSVTAAIDPPATTTLTCDITSITLTATGGISYSWSNGINVVGTDATLIVTAPGPYTVTVTAANGCTDTENIIITQSLPPATLTCPDNIEMNNDPGKCGAVVNYTPPSGPVNCGYTISQTQGYSSGSLFPVGTTINVFEISDGNGNTSSCTFTVTIEDNETPVVTCPLNISHTISTGCSKSITTPNPALNDNCGITKLTWAMTGATTGSSASTGFNYVGTKTFNAGETMITYTLTDIYGNYSSCSFTVKVKETKPPTITCPPNKTVNAAAGECYAANVILGTPQTSDNCGVASVTNDAPASGQYPVGITNVKWTVTDKSGNTSYCIQKITVVDNQDPLISCPQNITQTADNNGCTASIAVPDPTYSDNCGISKLTWGMTGATTGSSPTNGINTVGTKTFNAGTTTITYTVKDAAGRTKTCSFTVTVTGSGQQSLSITCPQPITQAANGQNCNTSVTVPDPLITYPCGGAKLTWVMTGATTGSSPTTGINYVGTKTFKPGTTTITYTLKAASGQTVTCNFTVTITDDIDPTIICPQNITANAGNYCSKSVSVPNPTVSDNCSIVKLKWTATGASSGSSSNSGINYIGTQTFNAGVTTVTYTAIDGAGNTAFCSFTVTVIETKAPAIICPPEKTVYANAGCYATGVVLGNPSVSDNCGIASVTNDAPSQYPVGITYVTWIVTDKSGNTKSCTQKVKVLDNQKPVVTCPADQVYCKNPNGLYVIPTALASDNCAISTIQYSITGATYRNGSGTDASGTFNAGISTIKWTVTDIYGNVSTCTTKITILPTECLTKGAPGSIDIGPQIEKLEATAYPNPTEHFFNVRIISSNDKDVVEIRVFDMNGKMVQQQRGSAGQVYRLGDQLITGMYMIEVRQAGKKATTTVVKQ